MFFKFTNKFKREFLRCAPPSSHVCDFYRLWVLFEKCFRLIFFWSGSKAEIDKTRDYGWNCCKLKKEEGIHILICSDITLSWCCKLEWQLNNKAFSVFQNNEILPFCMNFVVVDFKQSCSENRDSVIKKSREKML